MITAFLHCAYVKSEHLLADSYQTELIQNNFKDKNKEHLAYFFNFLFEYNDDVLSINYISTFH